jgi:hypothetical protein
MITKGPIISYYERQNTWNMYLDGDIDIEDPYIYWCNSQYMLEDEKLKFDKLTFKNALMAVKAKRRYPILVRTKINSISRADDECYIIHNDAEATMAILRHTV